MANAHFTSADPVIESFINGTGKVLTESETNKTLDSYNIVPEGDEGKAIKAASVTGDGNYCEYYLLVCLGAI